MGRIVIEEYAATGAANADFGRATDRDAPIADLSTCLATTVDTTTSTTAESITLNAGTRVITVYADEDHRVTLLSSDGSAKYGFVAAGSYRDFGVIPEGTLYYKADA